MCRKLHLKDFIPTEVQRLVKYRLLFHELAKSLDGGGGGCSATPESSIERIRLARCTAASSDISLYVNQAVTECENKKRCTEIQSRMDTREFDSYASRSPLLVPYKSLDIRQRKLVYEGELEWNMNGGTRLVALLFNDILVFVERGDDAKRRYILKPLTYTINKAS